MPSLNNLTVRIQELSEETIAAMRCWIAECEWGDIDEETELSAEEIVQGIARHYSGGVKQFLQDME